LRLHRKPVFATAVIVATLAMQGCGGPSLPGSMTFDGVAMDKAADWSNSGFSGVVFVPPGEKLDTASLQLGVLLSEKHNTGEGLSQWSMEQYRRSPTMQLYEEVAGDEACKVGATSSGTAVRQFLALHICRAKGKYAACAEADERLVDPSGSPCGVTDTACWRDMCASRWKARRASLEPIVDAVLGRKK
jgi:hypothetical protein